MHLIAPVLLFLAVFSLVFNQLVSPRAIMEIGSIVGAAIILPPITFFLLCFCLFHSVRHLFEVRVELSDHSLGNLAGGGAPYAGRAILGTLWGSALFVTLSSGLALLSAVFIALASLTVPHMLLVGDIALPPLVDADVQAYFDINPHGRL